MPGVRTGGDRDEGALAPYLRALRRSALVAALAFVGVFVITVAWSQLRHRNYKATANLLVTPLPQDDTVFLGLPLIRDSGDPTRTVETAASVVDSPTAAARAAQVLGGSWNVRKVDKAVAVLPEGASNIIAITASAGSASEAVRVADAFASAVVATRRTEIQRGVKASITDARQQLAATTDPKGAVAQDLADRISQLQSVASGTDPTLALSQTATAPTSATGISTPILIALGIIAGLGLASGLALLIDLVLPARTADENDLLEVLPLPILARVPLVPRNDRENRHPLGVSPIALESYRTMQVQLELAEGRHRTIAVTSADRGDGKTTTTVGLAVALAEAGHAVILIDFDLRKPDLQTFFSTESNVSSLDVIRGRAMRGALVPITSVPGLELLPAPPIVTARELQELGERLPELLENALDIADYVVIDTPPLSEVSDALKASASADDTVIVARLGRTRNASLEVTRDLLDRLPRPATGYVVIGTGPGSRARGYGVMASREEVAPEEPPSKTPRPRRERATPRS